MTQNNLWQKRPSGRANGKWLSAKLSDSVNILRAWTDCLRLRRESSAALRIAAAPCAAAIQLVRRRPGCRTRLVVRREFELKRRTVGGNRRFSIRKSVARPERLLRGLRPLVLRFAADRRRKAAASQSPAAIGRTRLVCLSGVRMKRPGQFRPVGGHRTEIRWCARRDSNSRPPGSKGKSGIITCLQINHLRRLPGSSPVSPRHSHGTPSLGMKLFRHNHSADQQPRPRMRAETGQTSIYAIGT